MSPELAAAWAHTKTCYDCLGQRECRTWHALLAAAHPTNQPDHRAA